MRAGRKGERVMVLLQHRQQLQGRRARAQGGEATPMLRLLSMRDLDDYAS